MKISNILSIALVVFVITALVYEKSLLRADSNKIDRSIQFGDYPNVLPVKFNHVVVKGGNVDGRVELHQRPKTEIRFKDAMKSKFKYHITNDTLYIALNEETTKPYFYDWSDNKVIVLFETIASFSFENSQNSMYCKQLSNLKIRGKGINSSRMHLVKVDSLDIKVTDKTKLKGIKSKANHLKVRAEGKSDVSLYILTATENDIKFTEEATVKIK